MKTRRGALQSNKPITANVGSIDSDFSNDSEYIESEPEAQVSEMEVDSEEEDAVHDEEGFSPANKLNNTSSNSSNFISDGRTNNNNSISKRQYNFKTRKPNPRKPSKIRDRRNEVINSLQNVDVQSWTCCVKMKCFNNINVDFLKQKMVTILGMSQINRRQALSTMIGSAGYFLFDGRKVCASFLYKAFGISRDVQASVRSLTKRTTDSSSMQESGTEIVGTSNSLSSIHLAAPRKESIVSFLLRIGEDSGDRMPDNNEVHLPFHKKLDVYHHFKHDFQRTTSPTLENFPSLNYFLSTWKSTCRQIKIRKTNRFSKCDVCERLKDEIKQAITNFESTTPLLEQKRSHYKMISDERLEYKRKKDMATLRPQDCWSFIIDGADQTAFGLPHFTSSTKSQSGNSLKVKLVGVLEHALENKLRLLTMTEEHKTGSNHIIESIHRFLMDRSLSCPPPPKLFIQVDNCTRENKNRFFFSYIESLVGWNVFREIEVSFLPIGHTHEDIDQAFSTTSARLKVRNAITLADLHHELRQVYNTHTTISHMKHVVNWSQLCENEKLLSNVKNFSHLRYFRFQRNSDPIDTNLKSIINCSVKASVYDEWMRLDQTFLKALPDLSKTPPTIIEDTSKTWEASKASVTKRIESEEFRILVPRKIGELKELRDSVFRPRKERFHWNLSNTIELRFLNNSQEHEDEIEIEQPLEEDNVNAVSNDDSAASIGYHYEINSFVAVLSETADKLKSFWIGKVTQARTKQHGVVKTLTVHWYEPYTSSNKTLDKYGDKYAPSYLQKGGPKQSPWKSEIESSAVIINFNSLLRNRRLPATVQKHIRASIPSIFK